MPALACDGPETELEAHRGHDGRRHTVHRALCNRARSLGRAWPMQALSDGCAEFEVGRGHFRGYFAALKEAQHSLDPSEMVLGVPSFCALRGGASSSSLHGALGVFGL